MRTPRFELADGSYALMHAVVQTANYRRGYVQVPLNAEEEIKRIAALQIPSEWRRASLVLLSRGRAVLDDLMTNKKLPTVLSVGEFVSHRGASTPKKPIFRYVAWLQEEIEPHMDAYNRELFRHLDWDHVE
jgi:hypothetical protein